MYKISQKLIPKRMESSERVKLIEQITSYRSTDDVVAYLLALLKKETIPTDDETIHTAFYKLKKEYPDFFKDFIFTRGDLFPFSKDLEEILFRFQQSYLLGTINPTYEKYILKSNSKEIIKEKLSERFTPQEKVQLTEMVGKLENYLSH
jgi:hypothetical protein